MDPGTLALLIPIIAIGGGLLMGGFSQWLEFKSQQRELGASTHELEEHTQALREALDASEKERRRLTERVQNLETIVTSQAWDTLHEGLEQGALGDGRASSLPAASEPQKETSDAEKAERLARRVQ